MIIRIAELSSEMENALIKHGLSRHEARIVSTDYLEAELRGKKTHGVAKFCKELPYIEKRKGTPEVTVDTGAMAYVDANGEIGQLAANFATKIVIKKAKKYGIAAVGMRNMQRYGSLEPWARQIADNGLIGIVMNSCEPAVAPYGAVSKVLGSNPFAVGIPTLKNSIVIDMATSKVAMSTIWKCLLEGERLPANTFFDHKGKYTRLPSEARSVETFGGHKGYALSLAIQIISGSLVSAKMGSRIKSPYDIGYYFQAIDPSVFQDPHSFKSANSELIKEIKSAKKRSGTKEIFVPGEKSARKRETALNSNLIKLNNGTASALARLIL